MNIMKTLVSKLKKIALRSYFFIAGLALFNLGIFLFSLDLGLISSGLTLVSLAVIINIEKGGK